MVSDGAYMWFGIPGRSMQYVPAPGAGFQRNWQSARQQLALEDGRQALRIASQRYSSFQGDFFGDARELVNIDVFNKYASGYYGSGPIVFADPYAATQNVFAPQWATPALAERGWAPITGFDPMNPPAFGKLSNSADAFGRPDRFAYYNITTNPYQSTNPITQYNHYIAIPPDSTLYLGASGTATGTAAVLVQTYGPDNQPVDVVELGLIDYDSSTQFSDVFHGSDYSAVRVYLSRKDTSDSSLTLFNMMGQVWPSNLTINTDGLHMAGQGHMGLTIAGDAIAETYNYNGIKKGLSLTLEEAI